MIRSKLFVPAIRPELYAKAELSAADWISFDLEDSVPEDRKDEAREVLAAYLGQRRRNESLGSKPIIVRVNSAETPYFAHDIAAIAAGGPNIINLPMAEEPERVSELAAMLERTEGAADTGILVNIETPRALRNAHKLAQASKKVMGLQVGYADLLEPCGMDRHDEALLTHIRLIVRFAAAEAGIIALDAAYTSVKDLEGFRRECMSAKRHGYAGKTCVHPSQIEIANEVFAPSQVEIVWARKVVAAAREASGSGLGAFLLDGRMIDKPFILQAQRLLAAITRSD